MTLPAATTPPTSSDVELLAFASSAELAARDLYLVAVEMSTFTSEEQAVLVGFHDHHRAAGQALAGLVGKAATNVREDSVYNAFRGRLMGANKSDVLNSLRELENTLVATHVSLVGALDGTAGSAMVASILTIQARQAAILALLAGGSLNEALTNDAVSVAPGANG